jgi:hypothetical protein
MIMIANVHLGTVAGEDLLIVQANDFDPYVTFTIRQHSVDLTRDQARQAGDALRACALTSATTEFDNGEDIS